MSTFVSPLDRTVSISTDKMVAAANSSISSLNTNLYNLSQQQQQQQSQATPTGGNLFDSIFKGIAASTGVANAVIGIKTNTPIQQQVSGQQQPGQGQIVYMQQPETPKKDNTILFIAIAVIIIIVMLLLLRSPKAKI